MSDWREQARCRTHSHPDMWFALDRGSIEEAKKVCRSCPVQEPCLAKAMGERFGVWAGVNFGDEKERRAVRRKKAA